ncbi:predicted protein [Scheffersomyces stipitis CBS 6054]|uniref:Thioredoxin domain-containing protein n=1 Tax=Scheffersomyces stipitis (strain ATCC 58785 / CBS 6054 / NBRC 10063 / NRRL Y-11545) TaxID=322104 RepID=A3LZL8_PICST|nr:predicted protein [Scheffersomyces stipitis CBS 6054]ABN68362.2 predicted protein [Scheffersomyces stipitis CBS 6054]KAG2734555.1 hypothetical protein G9P44_002561 [Scheffersomyces stipitis]
MDSKQSALIERFQDSKLNQIRGNNDDNDDDVHSESEDDLLATLDDDDDDVMAKYRESRIQQLSKEFSKINDTVKSTNESELGNVILMESEKQVMDYVTSNEIVLVHFFQPNFAKCKLMNSQLDQLAEKHLELNVVKIKAENAPFLVVKLEIRVLPVVVIYRDAKVISRIVGFADLGSNPDSFTYEQLENYMAWKNVISRKTISYKHIRSNKKEESDDDFDYFE